MEFDHGHPMFKQKQCTFFDPKSIEYELETKFKSFNQEFHQVPQQTESKIITNFEIGVSDNDSPSGLDTEELISRLTLKQN